LASSSDYLLSKEFYDELEKYFKKETKRSGIEQAKALLNSS
jgi:hypothetical protein